MNTGKISVRYSSALYSIAKERGEEESVYEQMHALSEAFSHTPGMSAALSNPMYSDDDKLKLLRTAIGADLTETVDQFFLFVVKKERLEFMPFMSMMYQEIYRKDKNIVLSKVITARKLKSEALEALRQKVSKSTGKQVVMYDETNEGLIGGFVLELNNLRYDASVKASLEKIESKLTGK